ncbi:MAG: chorismate synthase, partial [Acidobacteria bacterium]|nr:chorismate synthase [Acidobacteriota bacterium]
SRTVAVADVVAPELPDDAFDRLLELDDEAPMRVPDERTVRAMVEAVKSAQENRDSIGGQFEVLARGVPAGLGSHAHWDRRLDG